MRICTLVTDTEKPEFKYLQVSNKTPWPIENVGRSWDGWNGRMMAYLAAAKQAAKEGLDMMAFIDGYDVLMHPDAETRLLELRKRLGLHDIIVGAEKFLSDKYTDISEYHKSMPPELVNVMNITDERWAQMGVIVGKPAALVEMYEWILKNYRADIDNNVSDDQTGLGAYLNHVKWPKVSLDVANELVTNVWVHPWKASHAYNFTSPQDYKSAFIHFPGTFNKIGLSYQFNEAIHEFAGVRAGLLNSRNVSGLVALCGGLLVLLALRCICPAVKRNHQTHS